MKSLIIEDKESIRKGLIQMLSTLDTPIEIIGECSSVKEGIIVANACKPELIFLDIKLKDSTGFDFLEKTHDLEYKVIFITAYEEYALQALKFGAIDYLLKPINPDELELAISKIKTLGIDQQKSRIEKVQNVLNRKGDTLILSLQDSYQIINIHELMYCESDKGYTTFYMKNGKKYLASKSLIEFEKQLLDQSFTRPHQSYLVNLAYIDKYDKSGTIHLENGVMIPVSTRKKEGFIGELFRWNRKA